MKSPPCTAHASLCATCSGAINLATALFLQLKIRVVKFDGFEWYVQGSNSCCVNDAPIQIAIIVTFIEKAVV